jgi:hypothetical protein
VEYPLNQYAPLYQQGLQKSPTSETGYDDRQYEYPISVTFPTGSGAAPFAIQEETIPMETDGDFYLEAIWESYSPGTGNQAYVVQITDAAGDEITEGSLVSAGISQTASDPTVLSPRRRFARGTEIKLAFQNVEGLAGDTIQLVFRGFKRSILGA